LPLLALVFALFLTVGLTVQWLDTGLGLWFSEVFVFLAVPWVVVRMRGESPLAVTGGGGPLVPWLLGFALGAVNFFAAVVPIQFVARAIAPDSVEELFDASRIFDDLLPWQMGVVIAGVGIAAPLCEEFFFRGTIQRVFIARAVPPWRAIVAVAVIFSAFHLDPVGFAARLELGVLFGWLYFRTGTLGPCIAAHAGNNLVSTAVFLLAQRSGPSEEEPALAAVLLVSALGCAGMAALIALNQRRLARSRETAPPSEPPRSLYSVAWPWAVAALLSLTVLLALHRPSPRQREIERRTPAPKGTTEEAKRIRRTLEDLRQKARAGQVPLDAYEALRRRALEGERVDGGEQRPSEN
jgi:membrane protease YdiL (CAAX protease family)